MIQAIADGPDGRNVLGDAKMIWLDRDPPKRAPRSGDMPLGAPQDDLSRDLAKMLEGRDPVYDEYAAGW